MEISITWNICRVCLVEEEKKPQMAAAAPMCHIFNEDKMLAQQIYECSGITIKPNDNLPEKICKKCYTSIKQAINLRKTCRASDTYLQNILQRTKSASELFKKQQPLSQDSMEDIINNDSLNSDNNAEDVNDIKAFEKPKCEGMQLENDCRKIKVRDFSDLIELENEVDVSDNDLEDSLAQNDILEYDESCIDAVIITEKHEENSNNLQMNIAPKTEVQLIEETENETDFLEENPKFETGNLKQNKDDAISTNSEKKHDDSMESYGQIKKFVLQRDGNRHDITVDMESESEDSQARVSSTVAIKEIGNDIMGLNSEETSLSSETNDMQPEYIIDEYLVDDNTSDSISLQNSSLVVVHSKKTKSALSKQQKDTDHSTKAASTKKTTKAKTGFQAMVCEICGNNFGNRQLLNAHMKVHRQEKNHECEICLKRFITACNLQAHMRIHTGEKPFECKYCGRRFNDRSSNLRHERTHTNEKPYECIECGKAFSLATTLKKHLTVHTGERSFSCDICAKAFKLPHQLKAHKKSTLHKAVEQLTQMDK